MSVVVVLSLGSLNAADLKVTTVRHYSRVLHNRTDPNIFRDQDWKRTEITYVHGPWRRFEYRDEQPFRVSSLLGGLSHAATIENCDTRESITLDLEAKEYKRANYGSDESMRAAAAQRRAKSNASQLARSVRTRTVATGETILVFGHSAHHFVTTSHATPLGEAAVLMGQHEESTVDAWYLDAEIKLPHRGCLPDGLLAMEAVPHEEKRTGPVPRGFPVRLRRVGRFTSQPGPTEYTETLEINMTELSEAPLDPSLFSVPPGYKLVTCLRGQPCSEK